MDEEIKSTPAKQDTFYSVAERVQMGENGHWYIYSIEEDKFYIYEDGCWRIIFEFEILAQTSKAMPGINKYPIGQRKQIIENMQLLLLKRLDLFNKDGYINFREGLFDLKTGNIIDHHPDYYSTLRMDYNYNWNANCPLWLKTLGEIFEDDEGKINILQEFCGYCLTKDTSREKALLLLGESRTGKSTILQTIRALIGTRNCSSVAIKSIANPQYMPLLMNKLVNIDSDVSSKAQDYEAEFKIITSGEPISCNQKFIPTFEFTPYCKLLMAANSFPRIADHSSAFYKRLILIPCERVFDDNEQDIRLKENLHSELSGIFNWAYEGLERLNARGKFEHNKFMTDAIKELSDENNPSAKFIDEHIQIKFGSEVRKDELYQKYKAWCEERKAFAVPDIVFSKCITTKFGKQTPKDSRSSMAGRPRVWRNIEWVPFKSDDEITKWED